MGSKPCVHRRHLAKSGCLVSLTLIRDVFVINIKRQGFTFKHTRFMTFLCADGKTRRSLQVLPSQIIQNLLQPKGHRVGSRYSDMLRAGRFGDRIPVEARFSAPVQTGPRAHPAFCTMGTRSFPRVKSGRGVTLTPLPLLVPWSWQGRAIPLLSLWAVRPVQSLSVCTRVHFWRAQTFSRSRRFTQALKHQYLESNKSVLSFHVLQFSTYHSTSFPIVVQARVRRLVRQLCSVEWMDDSQTINTRNRGGKKWPRKDSGKQQKSVRDSWHPDRDSNLVPPKRKCSVLLPPSAYCAK
jgi:hypothetical protein